MLAFIRSVKSEQGDPMEAMTALFKALFGSLRDLMPIIFVIAFFQLIVLQEPLPNLVSILFGLLLVVFGLTFFIFGLEMGLFPIGESMAQAFARKGSVFWLLIFAFCLGFGTTVAEPALTAVAGEAAEVAAEGGMIANEALAMEEYANGLRYTVALSVGIAILLGVLRILKGWPIQYMIIGGYIGVVILTMFAPPSIIGVAYDSGGVTTSTITVPLVTALGVGLASAIKGRNPMIDGFGLIAFASLLPMMFVMVYGMVVA
ncbi:major facilitator superfamily permease [Vibrio orientalis CIP 102891 = ATCC 33934]|uniref:Major facilitator superfamily permease n=2 Tax=Vibrio orientalis TaxID=28175 RepID=F9SSN7_VIBOR|nr:major facilitator superfamily permease [Vibrio orientalis CIP 102891 = ATCC 33934]